MLLMEIEEHIQPLSKADKEQLLRDIWRMLQEETGPDASQEAESFSPPGQPVGQYPPIDTPDIAKQLEALL